MQKPLEPEQTINKSSLTALQDHAKQLEQQARFAQAYQNHRQRHKVKLVSNLFEFVAGLLLWVISAF